MYAGEWQSEGMPAPHSACSHYAGLLAEECAARGYEIDGGRVRKARRHGAETVTARQWARIGAAASRYLAEHTDGTVPCRFDLALVDRMGRLERIENARSFDDW